MEGTSGPPLRRSARLQERLSKPGVETKPCSQNGHMKNRATQRKMPKARTTQQGPRTRKRQLDEEHRSARDNDSKPVKSSLANPRRSRRLLAKQFRRSERIAAKLEKALVRAAKQQKQKKPVRRCNPRQPVRKLPTILEPRSNDRVLPSQLRHQTYEREENDVRISNNEASDIPEPEPQTSFQAQVQPLGTPLIANENGQVPERQEFNHVSSQSESQIDPHVQVQPPEASLVSNENGEVPEGHFDHGASRPEPPTNAHVQVQPFETYLVAHEDVQLPNGQAFDHVASQPESQERTNLDTRHHDRVADEQDSARLQHGFANGYNAQTDLPGALEIGRSSIRLENAANATSVQNADEHAQIQLTDIHFTPTRHLFETLDEFRADIRARGVRSVDLWMEYRELPFSNPEFRLLETELLLIESFRNQ